jgi:squalene-associated FAD-dependent desaturase
MKRCLIIGGGIAGLTAASILSSKKIPVTLIESSPKLGGRTYSFMDEVSGEIIDNGQHIMMGCYKETLSFLTLIGANENFIYQTKLKVDFIDYGFKKYKLHASNLFYPLNLFAGFLNYNAFTTGDKIRFFKFIVKLPFVSKKRLSNFSVKQWLNDENQSEKLIKSFWEILCVGSLNSNLEKASAQIFADVLKQIFFTGNFSSTIILPKLGLTESIIDPAFQFIKRNGGEIISSDNIKQFVINENKIVHLISDKNTYSDYDFIISAIPLHSLEKIIPKKELDIKVDFAYSTIVNVHIWLNENPLKENFYGLVNSPVHWIFNKGNCVNIVISDADDLADKPKEEIFELVISELKNYAGIRRSFIDNYKVIKEKRATFIPTKYSLGKRPQSKTQIKNLFLAGDWIDTGLPSTIESAAKSGSMAANLVLKEIICNNSLVKN